MINDSMALALGIDFTFYFMELVLISFDQTNWYDTHFICIEAEFM